MCPPAVARVSSGLGQGLVVRLTLNRLISNCQIKKCWIILCSHRLVLLSSTVQRKEKDDELQKRCLLVGFSICMHVVILLGSTIWSLSVLFFLIGLASCHFLITRNRLTSYHLSWQLLDRLRGVVLALLYSLC